MLNKFLQYLDRVAVSSLPGGDVDMLHSTSFDIIPRSGYSIRRSWYHQELISSPDFKGKLLLLPDVGKFEIQLNAFDPALLANGICSRYPSEITLYKNRNRRINRYLVYIFYRMHTLRSKPHAYWCYTQTLIRTSNSYMIACLHSVDKNLYRKKTIKELRMLLLRLNRMRGHFSLIGTQFGRQHLTTNHGNQGLSVAVMQHYLKFFRIYIPKGTDSHRPLGVPVLAWRIFQKMWLPPLFLFTQDLLPQNFHGYIPKRGCGTAWKEILTNAIHKENIYEVDFKQFFPSVDTDFLLSFMLNKWNITLPVAVYLYQLNQSKPIFLESKSHDLIHGEIRFTPAHQVSLIENQAKLLGCKSPDCKRLIKGLRATGLDDMDTYFTESELLRDYSVPMKPLTVNTNIFTEGNQLSYTPGNTKAWIEAQRVTPKDPNRKLRESLGIEFKGNIGLPQGGTLSPYLSILYLEEVLSHLGKPSEVEYLFYADDGIFYSDNLPVMEEWLNKISAPEGMQTLSHYNIQVNKEKSNWVKRSGNWLSNLKFLGLLLIPGPKLSDYRLLAATRKGSTLELSSEIKELTHFEYAQKLVYDKPSIIKGKLNKLAKLPSNILTKTMIGYYEALLELHNSKLSPALFEYGYFLQKISATSMYSFVTGFLSSIFTLRVENKEVLNAYLQALTDPENPYGNFELVPLNLDGETEEELFGDYLPKLEQILYSKKSILHHESMSSKLLSLSHKLPSSVSPIFVPDQMDPSSILTPFLRDMTEFTSPWIEYDQVVPLSSQLSGDSTGPHPFIFFNYVLKPFKYFSTRVNILLDDSSGLKTLRNYFGKYQFVNLVNSKYFGLIMSRLYNGSYILEDLEQDFSFGYVKDSLAHLMHRKSLYDDALNIFNGSSYATYEMVRFSAYLHGQSEFERNFIKLYGLSKPKGNQPFKLFAEGLLPANSWS